MDREQISGCLGATGEVGRGGAVGSDRLSGPGVSFWGGAHVLELGSCDGLPTPRVSAWCHGILHVCCCCFLPYNVPVGRKVSIPSKRGCREQAEQAPASAISLQAQAPGRGQWGSSDLTGSTCHEVCTRTNEGGRSVVAGIWRRGPEYPLL